MEKAALYVRLSDEDEDKFQKEDLSQSIINQHELLIEYAKEHGFLIQNIYCDDDYSGLYDDRPGFQKLLADARNGKFNVIIAKSQSRFSRNTEHIEKYLHNEFINLGIRFIGVVDGTDTAIKSNKKTRQIYSLTNEWYCEELSDSIHAVFDTKIKQGKFIGSFAPYGYIKNPKDKNSLVVDSEAAKVVKRIFRLYISGNSIETICEILSNERIPSPAVYKKQQGLSYKFKQEYNYCEKYGLWSETTVRRILSNQSYIGHMVQGKTRKMNYKSKQMVSMEKEKWVIVYNTHEAIIDKDDFELVQKLLKVKVRRNKRSAKLQVLSGKLQCAQCGSALVRSGRNHNSTRNYIRCQLAKKSKGEYCTTHKAVIEEIEQAVFEKVKSLINCIVENDGNVQELSELLKVNDRHLSQKRHLEKKISDIDKSIVDTKNTLKSLYIDKTKGIIEEYMFIEMNIDFKKTLDESISEQQRLNEKLQQIVDEENRVKDYCKLVLEYCDIQSLTREMVNKFIDYIELSEDENEENQELIIHWNI